MAKSSPIFVLSGTPGAGKSTVGRALMARFDHGLHIPVDDLRELVVSGMAHPVPEWTEETGRQFGLARDAAAQMARLYAAAGFAVAIDDVIDPDDASEHFGALAREYALAKVLLYPSLASTLARNAGPRGKLFDTALLESTIARLHAATAPERYAQHGWLVLDTSALSPEQTVDAILEWAAEREPEKPVDQRGVLEEEVFTYRASRDKVFIAWRGKQVMILKGTQAAKFLRTIEPLEGKAAQLVMAKITGNFKHGNER